MPSEPIKNELRSSEEQLRSLVSSLDDFVFSIDLEGKFMFYQPMQWSIYDTPALGDAFIGALYKDVLPPEITSVLPGVIAQVNQNLSPQVIEYTLIADSSKRYYKGRVAPMFSSRFALIGYTFVANDVTNTILAQVREQRMLALEGLHRQIESTFFGSNDPDSAIEVVLPKIGEMLGVSRIYVFHFRENERRLDKTHEWCAADDTAQTDSLQNIPFDERMPSFEPLLTRDGVIMAKNIDDLPPDVAAILRPLAIKSILISPYHVNERLDGFLGLVETRQYREWLPEETAALRTAGDGYARLLERQRSTLDLIKARDTALLSAKHKSEFVAKMSHEIRTPMTALLGVMELLLETPLNNEQSDLLTMAQKNAHRLMDMLVEILDFSALEKGSISLQSVPVDIRGILTEVEMMWAEQARKKGLDFAVEVDDHLPERVLGDPARLRQVLNTLTNNAVKFTEQGKITLRARQLFGKHGRSRLRFEVKDTGIGIAPAKQEEIFDSFNQADNSLARRYGGAGLGLAICKQLVQLMEGDIDVHSAEGEGSTFGFTATFPTVVT